MIFKDGSVGAADQTAPTKGYEPPLKMIFVVVEEPHPNLARERAGCQEMVGGLNILIAKRADNIRLESMVFPAFNGPQTAVEREPEEELHLWRHGGPPDEHGSN